MMTGEQRNLIETPCKNICVVDPETAQCIGCGRTRIEIAGWLTMSADQRAVVTAELDERMATLTSRKKRKGGARNRRNRQQALERRVMSFPIDVNNADINNKGS